MAKVKCSIALRCTATGLKQQSFFYRLHFCRSEVTTRVFCQCQHFACAVAPIHARDTTYREIGTARSRGVEGLCDGAK